jgi:two-component sensor histidine kinase
MQVSAILRKTIEYTPYTASRSVRCGLPQSKLEIVQVRALGSDVGGSRSDVSPDLGDMVRTVSDFPWRSTALGPPGDWPQSLKTAVSILLKSPIAMVLLWGEEGVMIYNDAYAGVAGGSRRLGMSVYDAWPELVDFNREVIRVGMSGGTLSYRDQELTLYRSDTPDRIWMDLDYGPVLDETGNPGGVLAIVVNTTDRVLAERRVAQESERLREMFQQAPGFIALMRGENHVFEIVNEAYLQLIGHRDVVGKPVAAALQEIPEQGFLNLLDEVWRTGQPFHGHNLDVLLQRTPGALLEQRVVDFVYQPVFDSERRVSGIFLEGIDVTERVRAEERQELILREMHHRVKNLFAVASSLVAMSARSAVSPQALADTIQGRLGALARASACVDPSLDEPAGRSNTLEGLIKAVLSPYQDELEANPSMRITCSGPDIAVDRAASTSLALFLHEAATNAAKYGALREPEGRVAVSWRIDEDTLQITWQERGRTIDTVPGPDGFGTTLVKRSIEGQLSGRIAYLWEPDGLRIDVSIPTERLA